MKELKKYKFEFSDEENNIVDSALGEQRFADVVACYQGLSAARGDAKEGVIELDIETIGVIGQSLGFMQYRLVYGLINKINVIVNEGIEDDK